MRMSELDIGSSKSARLNAKSPGLYHLGYGMLDGSERVPYGEYIHTVGLAVIVTHEHIHTVWSGVLARSCGDYVAAVHPCGQDVLERRVEGHMTLQPTTAC